MSRTAAVNLLALLAAIATGWWAAGLAGGPSGAVDENVGTDTNANTDIGANTTRFHRVASASAVADELVMAMADPDDVIALSAYSLRIGARTPAFQDKTSIGRVADIAHIISLQPDLLIAHNVTDPRHTARLRENGIRVVDLGSIEGLATLGPDINQVAQLLGVPERGLEVRTKLEADLAAIARDIPEAERKRGLYVTLVGKQLYGGTVGSSYHDVLKYAGIVDVAANTYKRWPSYSAEQLLALDPPMIVTAAEVAGRFCAHPGLNLLTACKQDAIVGVDGALMGSAGLRIVDAARALHEVVYKDR